MAYQSLYSNHRTHRAHGLSVEYRIYFGVILVASAPFALAKWTLALARPDRTIPNPGVLDRALSEARAITPTIFSA